MHRTFYLFVGVLLFFAMTTCTVQVVGQVAAVSVLVDEEYDRYKKRADDSFGEGDYHNALRQYHNCLAVPGFETDPYAQKKIAESTTCVNLSRQAETALRQRQGLEAIGLFDKLLTINPDDRHTKNQVVDFFEKKGDGLFDGKKYVDASKGYERAISYATGQKKTDLSNKLTNVNKLRATSQRLKLQMATGVVAIGATVYALILRSDYVVKKNTLDQISLGAENPALPGTIDNADTYSRYKVAYADAQAAGKKQGLYIASVGLAVVATLAEVYLLRNSSKRAKKMVMWKPSSYSVGLTFSYTF